MNIIEGIAFASGEAVPVKYIVEKLGCSVAEVNSAIGKLKEKYSESSGIQLLTFNGKIQFATNPSYKQEISDVLAKIKEKELTKTILECIALIAYKQPVTKGELEELRGVNCDYAVHTLLELQMIEPCGRKDAIGKPILYATTDNFLKRFGLNSVDDLPDYDELMAQIAELNDTILKEDDTNYLYKKDEYTGEDEEVESAPKPEKKKQQTSADVVEDGFELPVFLEGEENVIKIK
ncbi:MAG: SMC-Scp complex subunit ScpB [Candidatus Coproplasma sp.]